MATLGSKYYEIGRGHEKISEIYSLPYIIGVDITERDKPFVVAVGDHHPDIGASKVSVKELISGKWDEHIALSNCVEFVEKLKRAMDEGETFPQQFILELINARTK